MAWIADAAPFVLNTNLQVRHILNTATADGAQSVRIAKDPRNDQLYCLKLNGDIYQANLQPGSGASTSTKVYGAADHGISEGAQGMAFGPSGAIFIVGNSTTNNGDSAVASIMIGTPNSVGRRDWGLVARSQPYPRSKTAFDHGFNGIVVSPDGSELYVSSGSRTDHGEVQSGGGIFRDTREVPITATVFPMPANAANLIIYASGLVGDPPRQFTGGPQPGRPDRVIRPLANGLRNCFDLAFAANGDLFGTDNGPDRDMPDELNWIRRGNNPSHFGFPWRMGGQDNPQQFANYDPSQDRLLDPRHSAVPRGFYHNDPAFPPPPAQLQFAEPVINLGPDADSFRDPVDGQIKDASDLGLTLSTFTPHRSPLGLVFDVEGALAPPFYQHGFVLSWTKGDSNGASVPGPFKDASEDLLDLELTKLGDTNYQARVTRLVAGFANPIDAEIIGNKIYVLEFGGEQGIWEVTFPPHPGNDAPRISSGPINSVRDETWEVGTRFESSLSLVTVRDTGPNATSSLELEVTATSSNQTLVPNSNISLSGSGAYRYVAVKVLAGQIGEAIITLTVTDRGPEAPMSSSLSFKVTVIPFNDAPIISSIADQMIKRNGSTGALPFTVGDVETGAERLVVTVSSDNGALVPSAAVELAGNGANRTVRIAPPIGQVGTARITITVADGGKKIASTSFTLTVEPVPLFNGDFNGDGQSDLIFQDDAGFLGAWFMDGAKMSSAAYLTPSNVAHVRFPDTVFRLPGGPPTVYSSFGDIGFRVVGSADFNHDDEEDLLFQHTDGRLGVWLMKGTKRNSTDWLVPNHPGDARWRVAAVTDLEPLGENDIIFQHSDGTLAVWLLTGLGLTQAGLMDPSHPGDARWKVVGTGDLNGDGETDVILQHTDGTLAAWFMHRRKMISAALLDPPHPGDANWRVVATGQYSMPLTAALSGAAEQPAPATTTAGGVGQLNLVGDQLTFDIDYWGLTGPATAAHLHGPATSYQSAAVQIILAPNDSQSFGTFGSLRGTVTLNREQMRHVRQALMYVNIHTTRYPGGEIRGQVVSDTSRAGQVDLVFQHADGTLAIWFLDGIKLRASQLLTPSKPGATWRVVGPK